MEATMNAVIVVGRRLIDDKTTFIALESYGSLIKAETRINWNGVLKSCCYPVKYDNE